MLQEIMQFISQHPILSLAWVLLFGAVVFTSFKNSLSKVKEVTRGEATRLINKEDAVVVDIRKAGFERVFTLKEGISGWSGENLPLARGK